MSWQIRALSPREFKYAIDALGIDQAKCARFLGISERTTRRYIRGEIPIPPAHALLLRAMIRLRAKPVVPAWNGEQN